LAGFKRGVRDTGLKLEDISSDELVVVFEGDVHAIVNDSAMFTVKVGKATPSKPEGPRLA
jgi:hypothetical protein